MTACVDSVVDKKKLFKEILLFSLPLILTGILQLVYNAADMIIVGRLDGYQAMGAVGSTAPLINLIIMAFIGLSVGSLSATARAIGAKDKEFSFKVVHTSIPLSLISGVVVGIIGFFLSEKLLVLMKSPPSILPLSTKYLKVYFLGMPFTMLYNFGSAILKANGDSKRPLIILAISGIINVLLNYAFVAWAHLGVVGVAIATVVSLVISATAVLILLLKESGYVQFIFKKMAIYPDALKEIIHIGLPSGLQSVCFSFANVFLQSYINSFGDVTVAGNSAASSVEGFVYTSLNAISQATLTFASKSYGEKNLKKIDLVLKQSFVLQIVATVVIGAIVLLFSNQLLSLYNGDLAVIEVGKKRMIIIVSTYFLCGIMESFVGAIRGMGYSVVTMITAIFGACGLRIAWVVISFLIVQDILMVYLSYPISWALIIIVHYITYIIVRKKVKESFEKE